MVPPMARIKYATDSSHAKVWAEPVGKLILNFAGLELESLLWLVQMSEQVVCHIPAIGVH